MHIVPLRFRIVLLSFLLSSVPPLSATAFAQYRELVVSQDVLASEVGAHVLARNGNAVDAAVATAFALAVTHPAAGNIGGGGFMVIRFAKGRATTFDFRETAPLASTPDMFLDEDGNYSRALHHDSHRAVGVPGTVAGLWDAHRKYGRLPWRELLAPAVALARDGFPVGEALSRSLKGIRSRLERHAASVRTFYKKDGSAYSAYEVGDVLRQPELAATLARIQTHGRDGFYRGETADLFVAEMERGGGLISHADLTGYRAVEREPITGTYRGYDIISMPPPSSGGITLINMLNMLERFPKERDPVRRIHLLAEVMRRGYADRARHLGDPDFGDVAAMKKLVQKAHGEKLAASIDLDRASKSVVEGLSWNTPEGDQTTHFSVVDENLNAVSMTYTLEYAYGSGIVVPGAGFLLNNEMGDFNPKAGMTTANGLIGTRPNLVQPGKRMLSSMTPTIVARSGRPWLLVGSPGGRTIINTVFQIISNAIDLGLSVDKAVALGRLHHQWFPDRIMIEERLLDDERRRALEELGHVLRPVSRIGAAECIQVGRRRGKTDLRPGCDPRAPGSGAAGRKHGSR